MHTNSPDCPKYGLCCGATRIFENKHILCFNPFPQQLARIGDPGSRWWAVRIKGLLRRGHTLPCRIPRRGPQSKLGVQ